MEPSIEWVLVDKKNLPQVPQGPGVYRFYNEAQQIIYVGKSKQLPKRVASYFQRTKKQTQKIRMLAEETQKIGCVVVNTEYDALLLENSLIKHHQPKYNVLLRDDKTYPYLCLSNERFPRLYHTRKLYLGKGEYFGPYTDLHTMHALRKVLNAMLQLRTCKHPLSEKNVARKRYPLCLEYYMQRCQGPCVGNQTLPDYLIRIATARSVLQGKWHMLRDYLQTKLQHAIENMQFETAATHKDQLQAINRFQGKAVVVNPALDNVEVCTIAAYPNLFYVNYMRVQHGMIILSDTFKLEPQVEEQPEDMLVSALTHARTKHDSKAGLVLSNLNFTEWDTAIQVQQPKSGAKKKMVDISVQNARSAYLQNLHAIPSSRTSKVLRQLQRALRLRNTPEHIVCFDISNLGGSHVVGGMTCFKQGKPFKKGYRHFNTQVQGMANDYQAMEEVLERYGKRTQQEQEPLPDLIVIDGGKGQLNIVYAVLKRLQIKVDVIGLAKRVEEVFLPGEQEPLLLPKQSEALLLLQKIRDETHRFAINFHRKKRMKSSFSSILQEIKGIGPVSAKRLLQVYTSVEAIRMASEKELKTLLTSRQIEQLKAKLNDVGGATP